MVMCLCRFSCGHGMRGREKVGPGGVGLQPAAGRPHRVHAEQGGDGQDRQGARAPLHRHQEHQPHQAHLMQGSQLAAEADQIDR